MVEIDDPKYVMGGFARLSLSERMGAEIPPFYPALPVPTFEVEYTDISKWNGENIDFTKMRKYAQFSVVRGGYGDTGIDPVCDQHMQGLLSAGMERALYWFLMPRTSSNWIQALNSFISVWDKYKTKIYPGFDCEYTELSPADTSKWLYNLKTNWIKETGVEPIIYSRKNWLEQYTTQPAWMAELLGWFAQYNSYIPAPEIPAPWVDWFGWQWDANGNGEGHKYGANCDDMDKNRCRLTVNQFNGLFGTNIRLLGDVVVPPVEYSKVRTLTILNPRTSPVIIPSTDAGTISSGFTFVKAGEPKDGFQPVVVWLSQKYLKEVE